MINKEEDDEDWKEALRMIIAILFLMGCCAIYYYL